jgi:hypothetical protein
VKRFQLFRPYIPQDDRFDKSYRTIRARQSARAAAKIQHPTSMTDALLAARVPLVSRSLNLPTCCPLWGVRA